MHLTTALAGVRESVELIRNLVEIIGLPVIAAIALRLHSLQTEALKAENSLLKLTQYDQAEKLLNSQENLFERERTVLQKGISELESSTRQSADEITALRERIHG